MRTVLGLLAIMLLGASPGLGPVVGPAMAQQGGNTTDLTTPEIQESQQDQPDPQGTRSPDELEPDTDDITLQAAVEAVYRAPPDLDGNPVERPNEVGGNPASFGEPVGGDGPEAQPR